MIEDANDTARHLLPAGNRPLTATIPADLFDSQQWEAVQSLVQRLDQRQLLWLSGYLAGRENIALAASGGNKKKTATANQAANKLLIAFGSETGNSEALAAQLDEHARARGLSVEVVSLGALRLRQLAKWQQLLLICSTHGDGDPPEPADTFVEALMAADAPPLPQLRYAVLALGDSSYEHFCATGRQLDERLAELGAYRLLPREECDVDFKATAGSWMQAVLNTLSAAPESPLPHTTDSKTPTKPVSSKTYSKQQPLEVEVLGNVRLSAASRRSPLHHLELALDVDDFALEPGDAVGVLVNNPPALVAFVLNATGLSGEQPVSMDGKAMPLVQALRCECNLTVAGKRFLEVWAELAGSEELRGIVASTAEQKNMLAHWQIRDLLGRYPAHPEAQTLVDILRPLQPRLYDVANSLRHTPDELHLTISQYRYPFRDREETGIASEFLPGLQAGDRIRLYPHRNARFHLPADEKAPLILVAENAGIAPYRAFVQDILSGARQNSCWLVFADERFEQDFLYQTFWQQARERGVLQHVSTAFTLDHPEHSLATALTAEAPRLHAWLENGAHLYVCGDKARVGAAEHELARHFSTGTALRSAWEAMEQDKRLHRNLY